MNQSYFISKLVLCSGEQKQPDITRCFFFFSILDAQQKRACGSSGGEEDKDGSLSAGEEWCDQMRLRLPPAPCCFAWGDKGKHSRRNQKCRRECISEEVNSCYLPIT